MQTEMFNVIKSSSSRKRSTIIMYVPEDIIQQILIRLPAKSILRFKCVSKSWLSLISSPGFIKYHLNFSSKSPRIAFYGPDYMSARYPECINTEAFRCNCYPKMYKVVGSCNGLVCKLSGYNDLVLWNPCTRIHKRLPPNGLMNAYSFTSSAYEFGYNELSDDYKVLGIYTAHRLLGPLHDAKAKVAIYSSRTDSWKTIDEFQAGFAVYGDRKFVAGNILLCARRIHIRRFDIVSLDLENEVYGVLEQPDYGEGIVSVLTLEVLGESICLLYHMENHADLWIMKEYEVKESWSKIGTISLVNAPGKCWYSKAFKLPWGEILLYSNSQFVIYNPNNSSVRILEKSKSSNTIRVGVGVYVESLVSPIQKGRMGDKNDDVDVRTKA